MFTCLCQLLRLATRHCWLLEGALKYLTKVSRLEVYEPIKRYRELMDVAVQRTWEGTEIYPWCSGGPPILTDNRLNQSFVMDARPESIVEGGHHGAN